MNYKSEMQPVYLKEIKSRAECEINKDFILPDVYADIKKIVGCKAKLIPESGYADLGNAHHSGTLECKVIFVSDEGKLRCATFKEEYSVSVPYSDPGDDRAIFVPCIESAAAKAANPRKISVRARIVPTLKIVSSLDGECEYMGDMSSDEMTSLEVLSKKIVSADIRSFSSGTLDLGDDVNIPKDMPSIDDIVFSDVSIEGISASLSDNTVNINGVARITVGYSYTDENKNERTAFIYHDIPIKDSVEMDGIGGESVLFAAGAVSKISCEPFEDASGEKRVAEVDFNYEITVYTYKGRECYLPCDIFSCTLETEIGYESVKYPSDLSILDAKKTVSAELLSEGAEIVALLTQAYCLGEEKDNISGKVQFTVIMENSNGALSSATLDAPFEFSKKQCSSVLYNIYAGGADVTKNDNTYILSCETSIDGIGWIEEEIKYVKSVKKIGTSEKNTAASYTVFYPSGEETLWDVAKKYKVPIDILMTENSVDDSEKELSGAVFVPQNTKAVFQKMI